MATTVHVHASHALDWATARSLAQRWRQDGETRFALVFRVDPGAGDMGTDGEEHLHFTRTGLQGVLRVSDNRFELDLQLGHFLSPFKDKIQAALTANVQRELLALAATKMPGADPNGPHPAPPTDTADPA